MSCDWQDPERKNDKAVRDDNDGADDSDVAALHRAERAVGLIESVLGLPKGHFRQAVRQAATEGCSSAERERQRHDLLAAFDRIDEVFSRRQIVDLVVAMARRRDPDLH